MNAPVDQTTLVRLHIDRPTDDPSLHQAVSLMESFLSQAAIFLNECLNAGPVAAAMVQGSGYCGALSFHADGRAERALISPEELTTAMTLKLLEESPDE